jgi:two-component system, chemotaxis family, protein-glutamate methylesterase/glutaminase
VRAVVIGASTGGPPALATLLCDLPPDLDVPILVVQHMADGFVESLATWLDGLSPLPVVLAEHGRRLRPGVVHVAPAGQNTLLRPGLRIELRNPPAGQFHVPGVDAAFTSAAAVCGSHAIGVLLTGMGRDGAAGLRVLRDAGALTIGQDEPSCVVYGMPAAAQALGAVEDELPLAEIGPAIAAAVLAGVHGEDAPVGRQP